VSAIKNPAEAGPCGIKNPPLGGSFGNGILLCGGGEIVHADAIGAHAKIGCPTDILSHGHASISRSHGKRGRHIAGDGDSIEPFPNVG
jgi:hypothetical protein